MKSCRNCAHSQMRFCHSGWYRIELLCPVFGKVVAPPPSMNIEDNRKADTNCRTYASNCNEYAPEGESK